MAHDLSSIDLPRTISSGLSFKLLLTCRSIIIRTLFYSTINSVNLCLFPKALSIFIIDLSRASTVCPLWLLIFVYDRWSIGAISSDSIGPHARVPVSQANQDIDCIFSFRSSVTPLKTANQLLFFLWNLPVLLLRSAAATAPPATPPLWNWGFSLFWCGNNVDEMNFSSWGGGSSESATKAKDKTVIKAETVD